LIDVSHPPIATELCARRRIPCGLSCSPEKDDRDNRLRLCLSRFEPPFPPFPMDRSGGRTVSSTIAIRSRLLNVSSRSQTELNHHLTTDTP
jgi:hypothetical protein